MKTKKHHIFGSPFSERLHRQDWPFVGVRYNNFLSHFYKWPILTVETFCKFWTTVTAFNYRYMWCDSRKGTFEAKVKFYTTSDWRNLELEVTEWRRSLSGGFWPPLLIVPLCFPTLFFCQNLVTTKHVAKGTLILPSIELRAGDVASSGEGVGEE